MIFKIILSNLIILLSISTIFCQTNSEFASARIMDITFGFDKPRIIVAFGDKEGEIIPLNEYGTAHEILENSEKLDSIILENQKLINKFYEDMKENGYEIQEIEMSVNGGHFTYVIFRKKE